MPTYPRHSGTPERAATSASTPRRDWTRAVPPTRRFPRKASAPSPPNPAAPRPTVAFR